MTETNRPDPYQLSPDAVVEPPRTFGGMLKQIGPGLILTASIVGTGELIATTNLGAQAGFALLWLVLLSCFIKVFVQIELGRYAISSAHTTLASFHEVPKMGGVLSWWWAIMTMCTQFQIGAMIGACGYCIHMAAPGIINALVEQITHWNPESGVAAHLKESPEHLWAFVIMIVTIFLLVRGRYHVVERVCTVLVSVFTLLTVCFMVMLPWANLDEQTVLKGAGVVGMASSPMGNGLEGLGPGIVALGTVKPPPPDFSSVWIAAFAMIGITGVGASELISYPYWCLEKRYARYIGPREETETWVKRALGWLKVMHTDAWLSMIIYTLATIAFFVLGAAVLYHHTNGMGLSGNARDMLKDLAMMYKPVLGQSGSIWFIAIGGFIVLYSTLFAASAGNSRVASDFFRVQQYIPFDPPEYRIRFIRLFSGLIPVLGFMLYVSFNDPVAMVVFGGVAQALTLPMIAAVALFLRLKRTDKRLIKRGIWDILLWVSLVMFVIAAAWGIRSQLLKLLL